MILIGSKALNFHVKVDRIQHDWDIIGDESEVSFFLEKWKKFLVKETNYSYVFDIENNIIELRNPISFAQTDKDLINFQRRFSIVETNFGIFRVPNIQVLYDIKKSTHLCIDNLKHRNDTILIENNFDILQDTLFFKTRLRETRERISKENKVKHEFFHKYHLPEYIQHDRLHDMLADLLNINLPTYKRITTSEVEISETLFNKLDHSQKIDLMVEESLVISLERWLIPQFVENGINHTLIKSWGNNNEAMPTYLLLKHVCLTGLKGEAKYITDFSKDNFFEIEKRWVSYKKKIEEKKGFSNWFYDELFSLRKSYVKNEEIELHNKVIY